MTCGKIGAWHKELLVQTERKAGLSCTVALARRIIGPAPSLCVAYFMEEQTPNERPAGPPSETDGSMTRWIIAIFAMALLALGGYKGYQWWAVESDRTAATAVEAESTAAAAASVAASEPSSAEPEVQKVPGAVSLSAEADVRAPAVVGDNIINKCVINDQVTYTNDPCPEGTSATAATAAEATAVDPNGVTGFTGEKAPEVVARVPTSEDPSQQVAECHYLAAEIGRMDYEFQQQLPPPVLDQIATRLKSAREQSASLKCTGIPKEAAATKPASKSKVLQEKGD